jgi:uncharacterized membrane protein
MRLVGFCYKNMSYDFLLSICYFGIKYCIFMLLPGMWITLSVLLLVFITYVCIIREKSIQPHKEWNMLNIIKIRTLLEDP